MNGLSMTLLVFLLGATKRPEPACRVLYFTMGNPRGFPSPPPNLLSYMRFGVPSTRMKTSRRKKPRDAGAMDSVHSAGSILVVRFRAVSGGGPFLVMRECSPIIVSCAFADHALPLIRFANPVDRRLSGK